MHRYPWTRRRQRYTTPLEAEAAIRLVGDMDLHRFLTLLGLFGYTLKAAWDGKER